MALTTLDTGARSRSFWWDRARCAHAEVPALEAVIFDVDDALANPGSDDCAVVCDLVWGLYCSGVRIAIATAGRRAEIEPLVRELIGDGVVEVMITADDVARPKPDPEVYLRALAELGVSPANAMAVEDCVDGLHAARAAGLATVVVTEDGVDQDFSEAAAVLRGYNSPEPLSAQNCRRLRERWWIGHHQLTA